MNQAALRTGWTLLALLLIVGGLISPVSRPASAAISVDGWGTQDSGTTLTLYGIWGSSPSDIFACGEVGTVLRCDGVSWTPMSSNVTNALYGIWGSATDNVFAVGQNGCVIGYDGVSWNSMNSGTLRHLNAVWGSSSSDVYAVGNSGTVIHFDGSVWSPVSPGVTNHLRGVWGSSSTDVFVVGDGGLILHYDGSSTWTTMASGAQPKFAAAWGTSSADVFAVGDSGTIMHYNGTSWTPMTSGVGANLYGIWGPSANEVFLVGANGRILRYSDGEWNLMASGVTGDLYAIQGFSSINIYAAGSNGVILHYKEPAPIITSVSPEQANQGESLAITISGSNFSEATSIDLGSGVNITGWSIDSNFQISANITVSDSAATGSRDVSVTNAYGTGNFTAGFLIPHPLVTGITPDTGNQGEAIIVTISGSNLGGTNAVSFGLDISTDSLNIVDPSTVVVDLSIAPAADVGPREVLVMSPSYAATWSPFVVPAASGSSVTPDSGHQGETLDVAINGTNLYGATDVSFGDNVTVNSFDVITPTQITANITIDVSAPVGAGTVSILTPAGTANIAEAFTILLAPSFPSPSVAGVSPASGLQGQTLDVVITGANLNGTSSVSLGEGITVNGVTVDSATQLTVSITIGETAAAGLRCASVTSDGGTGTLDDCFTVSIPAPEVISLNLDSANTGETVEIVITGVSLDGATSVSLGEGITVNSFAVDSPTQITVNITIDENAASGSRDVSVTTPGGTDSLSGGFEIETLESGSTPFWAWILIGIVPLLLILFFFMLRRKKQAEGQRP